MKRLNFLATILVALSLVSCQDTKEYLRDPLSEKDAYRSIGEEIPFDTGMEWIEFYKKKRYEQGRLDLSSSFSVPAAQMKSALNSVTGLVGIAFHYAIDDLGHSHILVIPIDESLTLWSSISGRIILDANTGNEISQNMASAWAQRYKDAYPDEIWFHFFGRTVFDEMVALPYFNSVDIEPAISILDLTPELLLVVLNDDLVSFGRIGSSHGAVYDASNPCPPCAIH